MRIVPHRGKWAVYIDRKRISLGLPATEDYRADAERQARDYLSLRARALAGDRCASIMQAYLDDMPRRAQPKHPSESYRLLAKTVGGFFGDHTPEQVTREECRAYIAKRRAEGKADGTIRTELAALKAALRWFDPNTPARFDMPSPGRPRDRWLTRDEFDRLLAASPDHVKTFLHVAICTGARKEAILQMTWSTHVNFDRGTLWPGFKAGGKNRSIWLLMTDAAFQHLSLVRGHSEAGYLIEWGGGRVADMKRAIKRAYEDAGVHGVSAPVHTLRHIAGAWMAMGDPQRGVEPVPLLEISKQLGHSSPEITYRHYAHLGTDHMAASTRALEL